MGWRVVAQGYVYNATNAPTHRRWAAFTAATLRRDGTLLVVCRHGTTRTSPDGHVCIYASHDRGDSWVLRYDGYRRGDWDGTPGEVPTMLLAELSDGSLLGSFWWVHRPPGDRPVFNAETLGLARCRIGLARSTDGGRTWGPPRRVETPPHGGASPTGPALELPGEVLAQPYEHWKDEDDLRPAHPGAHLRLSRDGGETWPDYVDVAEHPTAALYYWDQRLATDPRDGRLVAMFWTHDPGAGLDRDVHIAWGSADGTRWSEPTPTGLPGQHCQPIALGGDRLLAAYVHRRDPPSIRVAISDDFGRTWDRTREVVVYASDAGPEAGMQGPRTQAQYWVDMGKWQFGHPRGVPLSGDEVFVVYYAGAGDRTSVRWARLG